MTKKKKGKEKPKSMTILEKIGAKLKEYYKTGKSKPTTPGVITINKKGEIKSKNVK